MSLSIGKNKFDPKHPLGSKMYPYKVSGKFKLLAKNRDEAEKILFKINDFFNKFE